MGSVLGKHLPPSKLMSRDPGCFTPGARSWSLCSRWRPGERERLIPPSSFSKCVLALPGSRGLPEVPGVARAKVQTPKWPRCDAAEGVTCVQSCTSASVAGGVLKRPCRVTTAVGVGGQDTPSDLLNSLLDSPEGPRKRVERCRCRGSSALLVTTH